MTCSKLNATVSTSTLPQLQQMHYPKTITSACAQNAMDYEQN